MTHTVILVRWQPYTPLERVTLPSPMTEQEARRYLRGLSGSKSSRALQVFPVTGEAAHVGPRCPKCGMLLRLHNTTLPQFANCY